MVETEPYQCLNTGSLGNIGWKLKSAHVTHVIEAIWLLVSSQYLHQR